MKLTLVIILAYLTAGTIANTLPIPVAGTNRIVSSNATSFRVLEPRIRERGENYRIWETVKIITNSVSGMPSIQMITNTYHELGSGICYQMPNGTWADSKAELTIARDGGAEGTRLRNKVHFNADLYSQHAVQMTLADGRRISATFRGLYLYDSSAQQRFLVSSITNSIGVILPPNRIVYSNCFEGIKGDLILTITPGSLEQDVVLRESLAEIPLQDFGLDPRFTVLEAWTEFFEAPSPESKTNALSELTDARGELHAGSLNDEVITFGPVYMRQGRAFSSNGTDSSLHLNGGTPVGPSIPVAKSWCEYENGNRRFLIESVRWNEIVPHFDQLNAAVGVLTNAAAVHRFRGSTLQGDAMPPKLLASASKQTVQFALANSPPPSAVVIDFTLDQTTYTDFTFEADTTYFVPQSVTIQNAVLRGGTVIKLENVNIASVSLQINGTITCDTAPGRIAIITGKDDNSVGEWISGSSGVIGANKYGNPGLLLSSSAARADLSYLRISHAVVALQFANATQAGNDLSRNKVKHSQFYNCTTAILSYNTWLAVQNSLFHNMVQVFQGTSPNIRCEHITAHAANALGSVTGQGSTIFLVNSILVAVADSSMGTKDQNDPTVSYSDEQPIFQTSIYGAHYLANQSALRGAGASPIDTTLASELKLKTTYPPVVLPGGTLGGALLDAKVPRNNGAYPDLGFAYDPIDYVCRGFYVEGGTMLITNGVTVGLDASAGGWGIRVATPAKVICQGSAANMNRIVEVRSVQEQPSPTVYPGYHSIHEEYSSSATPEIRLRFTELLGRSGLDVQIYRDGGAGTISLNDCQVLVGRFEGGSAESFEYTFGVTNNIFEGSKFTLTCTLTTHVQMWNNTFRGGAITLYTPNSTCSLHDNVFHQMSQLSANQSFDNSYNAYYQTTAFASGGPNVPLTGPVNYTSGPLGKWYIREGSSQLRDAGSRTATAAGLFYFTTTATPSREGNTQVDIGFHYAADFDGDGMHDYWEVDFGLNADSASGLDGGDGDADGDGVSNLREYLAQSSPVEWDGLANPLALPAVGSRRLTIISPTVLELARTLASGDTAWNFGGNLPAATSFQVIVDNSPPQTPVQVGFKQRPLYSDRFGVDTRVEKALYLVLSSPIAGDDNTIVQVKNSGSATVIPANMQFTAHNKALRYGPAIHVNHEGYLIQVTEGGLPFVAPQKAIVGYYCGELSAPASLPNPSAASRIGTGAISMAGVAGNSYGPVNLKAPTFGPLFQLRDAHNAPPRNNFTGWVGFKFVVGARGLTVTHLGRWVVGGSLRNTQSHPVKLVTANGTDVPGGSTTVETANAAQEDFAWGQLPSPLALTANTTYYLFSYETPSDYFYDYPIELTSAGLAQIDFSAMSSSSVKLVDAATGAPVSGFAPTISAATDSGGVDSSQYQGLVQIDFGGFSVPGEYRLQIDGLGASFPFRVDDTVAMKLARTYALGLYHQRCGSGWGGQQVNDLPFTRFTHGNCHIGLATVPLPLTLYSAAWNTIAMGKYGGTPKNADQKAPALNSQRLFPFSQTRASGNNGYEVVDISGNGRSIDVSGGHHDAGDYSRYTINSAHLIHTLVFAADNFPNVWTLDNLGIPESGDGASDILQEAKLEADFLLKMQDKGTILFNNQPVVDGGFYSLVYPKTSEYEANVLPENCGPQIVWPKTTAVTAAAVGALAEIGSSPTFCSLFQYTPGVWNNDAANPYLAAAKRGWDFLTRALDNVSAYTWRTPGTSGKDNCYQRCYFYGDVFLHNDELAWAAAGMFAAGYSDLLQAHDPHYLLRNWYPRPDDPISSVPFGYSCVGVDASHNNSPCQSWWYGWWGMYEGYGCAVRDYAFAALSHRRADADMNSQYLDYCKAAAKNWGHIVRSWSENNAYRTDLPTGSAGHGWSPEFYFPGKWTFDIVVADNLDTTIDDHTRNTAAVLSSLNFEAGCNPNNVGFLAGLGWRRQRIVVNQYWYNAGRVFPPTGNPIGSVNHFQDSSLNSIFYPPSQSGNIAGFPLYDRWADANTSTAEFVSQQTARSLVSAAWLAAQSQANLDQQWGAEDITAAQGTITPNSTVLEKTKPILQLSSSLPLGDARIVWDALGGQVGSGQSFTFVADVGENRFAQAEAVLPDGRRVFASRSFAVYDPINGGTECGSADANTIALYHFNSTYGSTLSPQQQTFGAAPNNYVTFSGLVPGRSYLVSFGPHCTQLICGSTTIPSGGSRPFVPAAGVTTAQIWGTAGASYDASLREYLFEDTSGKGYHLTIQDSSTDGTGVSLADNTTWMRDYPSSSGKKVVRFKAGVGYLQVGNINPAYILPNNQPSPVTIEAWIYPRAYNNGNSGGIVFLSQIYNSGPPVTASQWGLYYETGKTPDAPAVWANASKMTGLDNSGWNQQVTLNVWHKLVVTFDSSGTTRAYIDGVLITQCTSCPPIYNQSISWTLTIGNFDGDIDEVRISNCVRSQQTTCASCQ